MINSKKEVWIKDLSGVNTVPFNRYSMFIPLNVLLQQLIEVKQEYETNGYEDLIIHVDQDNGGVDMILYGKRDLNQEELDMLERVAVIGRVLDKTSKGLTRVDLLK